MATTGTLSQQNFLLRYRSLFSTRSNHHRILSFLTQTASHSIDYSKDLSAEACPVGTETPSERERERGCG